MGRLLLLDIDDDKYDGFVSALSKRPYIREIKLDREARKTLVECPICHGRLAKEVSFTINDKLIDGMAAILEKMATTKTVILVNKDCPIEDISPIERERCVELDAQLASKGVILGLLGTIQDGKYQSFYVTSYGVSFILGDAKANPATIVLLDGNVVEKSGEIEIEQIKASGKDLFRAKTTGIIRRAITAAKDLPEQVKYFVNNGQMSLI